MKFIITENQHILLRRYSMIEDEVYNRMNMSDPCYYKDYHDFDRYKRDVINSSVNEIVGDFDIDERVWENFTNTLSNKLNGIIRRYYNKVIKENCRDRW